jgi:hypothetical protein
MTLDGVHAAISEMSADRCKFGQCRLSMHGDADCERYSHSIVHSLCLEQAIRFLPAPLEEKIRYR